MPEEAPPTEDPPTDSPPELEPTDDVEDTLFIASGKGLSEWNWDAGTEL